MTTTNLSDFGYRELEMLEELLRAMREQGLPEDFYNNEVHPMMNQISGNVFLTNSEYQVAMMNGDKLESFYTLSYHGREGFLDELLIDYNNGNIMEEDWEQLANICESNGEIRSCINNIGCDGQAVEYSVIRTHSTCEDAS